jgi:acetate kinase
VLLLNAGSGSLKFALMDDSDATQADGAADWSGLETRYRFQGRSEVVDWRTADQAVVRAISDLGPTQDIAAVGHRWVHGGEFVHSVIVTPEVRLRLLRLGDLAPLHNPVSYQALIESQEALPSIPHVAVFDTAFHATLSPEARAIAIPEQWSREWGIRRYGFHGLNYEYCAGRAKEILGNCPGLRLVICHLGQGCSAAAVCDGRSVDTTMGFTPLDGLVMATRCGAIDPGVILHVQRQFGLSAGEVAEALNRQSGLLGLSQVSGDMRLVLAAADAGNERAQLALAVYCRQVQKAIGALATSLGGIDAIVFTGGVGEHSPEIRKRCCDGLQFLGVDLDAAANQNRHTEMNISRQQSKVKILVIRAREDLVMYREVRRLVESENSN